MGHQNLSLQTNLKNASCYFYASISVHPDGCHGSHPFHQVLGTLSILSGGYNFISFRVEVERDQWGVGLYKSKLSGKFIIYGSVNPRAIPWFESANYINALCVKSLSILDLQEQILLSMSAEKYFDLTNREKLSQLNKEKRDQGDPCHHGRGQNQQKGVRK